jgi:hypothetical protein
LSVNSDSNGRISGVRARGPDGLLKNIEGDNVVLACGGFEGNPEMLTQYVGKNAVDLPPIAPGLKYNRASCICDRVAEPDHADQREIGQGNGIRAAIEIGAGTSGAFDGIHAELCDVRSTKPDSAIFGTMFGILVNEQCKRFIDEGRRQLWATFELHAYEVWKNQNQKAFFVADSVIMDHFGDHYMCVETLLVLRVAIRRVDYSSSYNLSGIPPEKANTIPELAKKLGANPDKLQKTVNEYGHKPAKFGSGRITEYSFLSLLQI